MKRIVLLVVLAVGWLATAGQERAFSEAYRKGVEAMEREDAEGAMGWFRKALEENPQDGYSLFMVAGIRQAAGELDTALSYADAALRFLPEEDREYRAAAMTARGRILLEMGRGDEAVGSLTEAIALNPGNVVLYYARGEMLWQLDRYEESDKDFRRVAEMEPENAAGYLGLGRNAAERGRYREALEWFVKARRAVPDGVDVRLAEAECRMALGDYGKAGELVVEALEADAENGYAQELLADLAGLDFQAARTAVECGMEEGEKRCFFMGMVCYVTCRYGEAAGYYKEGYERVRRLVFAYNIAESLMRAGRPCEALQYAGEATELAWKEERDKVQCLRLVARVMFEMGGFEEAVVVYDTVKKYAPEYAGECWLRAGQLREMEGDYEAALRCYGKGVEAEPGNAELYYERGDLLDRHLGRKEEAEWDFRRVLELDTEAQAGSRRQYALAWLGRTEEAEAWVEEMVRNDTVSVEAYFEAARFYSTLRDSAQALRYLRMALERGCARFAEIDNFEEWAFVRLLPEGERLIEEYREKK